MNIPRMKDEKAFWGLLLLVSASFIILFTFFLMRIVYPFHIEQMKKRSRETVNHLQFVLPYLQPVTRQEYLENIFRSTNDLSYLLLMDINGNAVVHSNPLRVGMNFNDAGFRRCISTGEIIEQIYIRDADDPSSPYHNEQTIDILKPYFSRHGSIEGAVNVGISLAVIEKARNDYIKISVAGTVFWILFISGFAFSHIQTMALKRKADNALKENEKEYREHLESEIKKRTHELLAANKELETFSYSVSHDLRAPLRGIDGFSKALLEDYNENLDDNGKDYLHRIRTASQKMANLIDDMLKLSRLTRDEIIYVSVNLSEMAEKIMAELRSSEPGRTVEFINAPDICVNGDPQFLNAAMENLIGNAWKFTSKKNEARIEFGVEIIENKEVYFIRDNGAGFDMEYADKLFVAFQRLHGTTEFPGTGIGLAIVQRVMNRHGGKIWAESMVDDGTTFYFTI